MTVFGITRIADITGLDCIDIPVAQAIRPNGKAFSASQGKGISYYVRLNTYVIASGARQSQIFAIASFHFVAFAMTYRK
ncbi:hypothetical protein [Nostoc sp.]|uniref:hypothetical protein n=1 Tax=Nostoc sp. TaxID=1180 RepID=UPI002FF52DA4